MWEIMVEDVPFRSLSPADIKKAVLGGNALDLKSLPNSVVEIIKACCRNEPEKRPAFDLIFSMIEHAKF